MIDLEKAINPWVLLDEPKHMEVWFSEFLPMLLSFLMLFTILGVNMLITYWF
jgi:hypothetical protein